VSLRQDKLPKGLLWLSNDSYVSMDLIEDIECRAPLPCFIATEVYGNVNAPQVQELRDNVLMQGVVGRTLVRVYYSGVGERTANFIGNHLPSVIPVIRKGLDALVEKGSLPKSNKIS